VGCKQSRLVFHKNTNNNKNSNILNFKRINKLHTPEDGADINRKTKEQYKTKSFSCRTKKVQQGGPG